MSSQQGAVNCQQVHKLLSQWDTFTCQKPDLEVMEIQHFLTVLLGFVISLCEGKKDRELQCAVCRALVDEMNHGISLVDPKETIEVGSFRVDHKGNMNLRNRPYARSEVHLTELFEKVCDKFSSYALTKNSNGEKSVIPTSSRDGKSISLTDVTISSEVTKQMKYSCEHFVEEFEEEMIKVLHHDDVDSHERKICLRIAGICTAEDLRTPMPSPDSPKYKKTEEDDDADDDDDDTEDESNGETGEEQNEEVKEEL